MISIVIPLYNEADVVGDLLIRLRKTLGVIDESHEIVVIDDGSSDDTVIKLRREAQTSGDLRLVLLSRNFGQQAAYSAGMRYARGDKLVLMDGDLQDPPELIPKLLKALEEGNDIAYAIRSNRKETLIKRLAYHCFYRLLCRIVPFPIPVDSGDFGVMTRQVAEVLNEMPERHRFLRGMRSYAGFRQVGVPYERPPRLAGNPKYNWKKLMSLAFDGIFSFSLVPLRLASLTGAVISLCSLGYGCYALVWHIWDKAEALPGWASLAVGMFFLGGIQLLFLGIIGEYIGRIFAQVTGRPEYVVAKIIEPESTRSSRKKY